MANIRIEGNFDPAFMTGVDEFDIYINDELKATGVPLSQVATYAKILYSPAVTKVGPAR